MVLRYKEKVDELMEYVVNNSGPFLIFMVGVPLSGKDTFLREFKARVKLYNIEIDENNIPVNKKAEDMLNFVELCRDNIVLKLSEGVYNPQTVLYNPEVDKVYKQQLAEAIATKQNTIINKTNLEPNKVYNVVDRFKGVDKNYKVISVVFPLLTKEEYLRRDAIRVKEENKHIPEDVIDSFIESYNKITDFSVKMNKVIYV